MSFKVLVLHGLRYDSRLTTVLTTLSFAKGSSGAEIHFSNVYGPLQTSDSQFTPDLLVMTYEALALRTSPMWPRIQKRLRPVLRNSRIRVALPQDDYTGCAILDSFFEREKFDWVYSAIANNLSALYPKSMKSGVRFGHVLTGYNDPTMLKIAEKLERPFADRDIDVGQRVRLLPPQFGDIGSTKGRLAERFGVEAQRHGFSCDISTKESDAFTGVEWLKFLGNSRFTVGARSGASIRDPFGALGWRSQRLQKRGRSDEAISRALKIEKLQQFDFSAVSPRVFEAANMGVCQILDDQFQLEGFEPWIHYLPLKQDLSNIDDVFEAMKDRDRCVQVATKAKEFLVLSGKFDYSVMANQIFSPFRRGFVGEEKGALVVDCDYSYDSPSTQGQFPRNSTSEQHVLGSLTGRFGSRGQVVPNEWRAWVELLRKHRLPTESYFHPWISARSAEKLLGYNEIISWSEAS